VSRNIFFYHGQSLHNDINKWKTKNTISPKYNGKINSRLGLQIIYNAAHSVTCECRHFTPVWKKILHDSIISLRGSTCVHIKLRMDYTVGYIYQMECPFMSLFPVLYRPKTTFCQAIETVISLGYILSHYKI
jgi:hypothetical protein